MMLSLTLSFQVQHLVVFAVVVSQRSHVVTGKYTRFLASIGSFEPAVLASLGDVVNSCE